MIGEASTAVYAMLLELSPAFRETVQKIEADPNAHLTIRDPANATEQHGAAMQFVPGDASSGTILFNITSMNQNNFDLVTSGTPVTWVHTALSSMAHEMGHAAAHFGHAPRACTSDPRSGGMGCSIDFENKIRKEIPASIRGGIRDRY